MAILFIRRRTLLCLMALALLFGFRSVQGEEVKIVKVLDGNLFQLKDGRRIRLANVQTPSQADTNRRVRALAYRIVKYAEDQFLGRPVIIHYDSSVANEAPLPVHLFQKFPLKRAWYNKIYLERGYGKYVEEADTTYRAIYRKAEAKARRKKRGVWNPNLYAPGFPSNYAIQLMVGWGWNDFGSLNGYYREIHFAFGPTKNLSGFRIHWGGIITRHYREYSVIPETGIDTWWIDVRGVYNGKFIGIDPGLIFIKLNDEDFRKPLVLPSGRLKVGVINRVYLSFDFFTDLLYSPGSAGINFLHRQPYVKLWLGYTMLFHREGDMLSFKSEFMPHRRILLKIQAIRFHDYFPQEMTYGLRVGVGYVVK